MAIARVHTWSAGEVLTAADLNAEFSNILNNGSDLVSPFTKAISMGGFALNFDAANTIALTATTSGVILTGGTIREPTEDTLTAHAGGGQGSALALAVAKKYHRISVCATAGDSVVLPTSTAGQAHFIRNDGAAAAQVFGTSPDTVNGVATATGVPLATGVGTWYVCTTAGNWTTGPLVAVSGNFPVTFTATAATNVTLPTTGTVLTADSTAVLTNKTYDTAGTGNILKINGTTVSAVSGSGSVALATGPTISLATGSTGVTQTAANNSTALATTAYVDRGSSGASWVLLASGTASNSATIDFTQISSTYDIYAVEAIGIVPATGAANLVMRMSIDGGSTFKAGAGDYNYSVLGLTDGAAADNAAGTNTLISITANTGTSNTASNGGVNATIFLYNLNSTTQRKFAVYSGGHFTGSGNICFSGNGISTLAALTSSAVNAIRFLESSGNITSGVFYLYGIRKA